MQAFFLSYQWELFIGAEIISIVALLLFGITRYFFNKRKASNLFILLFIIVTAFEAAIAWIIYNYTGEISSFTVIITIFVLYAVTFGLNDFKKLDRWMRVKIGNYRGADLLTVKEHQTIAKEQNPRHKKRKDLMATTMHVVVFLIAQVIFWMLGTESITQWGHYLSTISDWIKASQYEYSPYPSELLYRLSVIWAIIVIIDIVYCASYLFKKS
ncbi:hypothetical protein [Metasolibacillus meyeri]|uniref:hypothetical protein n=1 Tax=Metasolibacillus meyeri TaxID=1071052 RepID=UPI000D31A386|nr:hypothetical protein [Metasolibacillus meyeri]